MTLKKIDLPLAEKLLKSDIDDQLSETKKLSASERKSLKELKEAFPISIEIKYKEPEWAVDQD